MMVSAAAPRPVVVDASIWVSRYVNQDVNHAISYSWLQRHFSSGGSVVAPMILLSEVAAAIARRTSEASAAHRSYRQLLKLPNFRIVPIDHELGLLSAKLAADLRLRGADAIYVALAQKLNLSLATLDVQQRDRAARVVQVSSPAP